MAGLVVNVIVPGLLWFQRSEGVPEQFWRPRSSACPYTSAYNPATRAGAQSRSARSRAATPKARRREGGRRKRFGQGAGDAVGHDVEQAASVGQVVLAGGEHERIGKSVEGAQSGVVVR